jgi:hypothetical protein
METTPRNPFVYLRVVKNNKELHGMALEITHVQLAPLELR